MAITWDTVTEYHTSTPFTTARTISHSVQGGANRRIWLGISTEDFSTGGGGQTPSSVTYNGNAMTQDGIITSGSVQTAAIYSGLDAVMGAAGAHNCVITYAGEVNAIVVFIVSADNMVQAVKEATGSTVALDSSNTGGTSTVVTVSDGAIIMAIIGTDNTANSTSTTWNVGTELGDIYTSMATSGCMVRYAKTTAGSQDMIATTADTVARTCMVSFAYAAIPPNAAPTIVAQATKRMVANTTNATPFTVADDDDDALTVVVACTEGVLTAPLASGAGVTIDSGNGTNSLQLSGSVAQFTSMGTVSYQQDGYTNDQITWDVDDGTEAGTTDTTDVTMWTTKDAGASLAAHNALLAARRFTFDQTGVYAVTMLTEDDNGNVAASVFDVVVEAASASAALPTNITDLIDITSLSI